MPKQSKAMTVVGWILSILVSAFMIFASAMPKFMNPPNLKGLMDNLGWSEDSRITLGVLEAACALLYIFPRTAVLGAIVLTGYLGGATATHVRVHQPFFFPVVVGVIAWLGLYLRDPRIRGIVPILPKQTPS